MPERWMKLGQTTDIDVCLKENSFVLQIWSQRFSWSDDLELEYELLDELIIALQRLRATRPNRHVDVAELVDASGS